MVTVVLSSFGCPSQEERCKHVLGILYSRHVREQDPVDLHDIYKFSGGSSFYEGSAFIPEGPIVLQELYRRNLINVPSYFDEEGKFCRDNYFKNDGTCSFHSLEISKIGFKEITCYLICEGNKIHDLVSNKEYKVEFFTNDSIAENIIILNFIWYVNCCVKKISFDDVFLLLECISREFKIFYKTFLSCAAKGLNEESILDRKSSEVIFSHGFYIRDLMRWFDHYKAIADYRSSVSNLPIPHPH